MKKKPQRERVGQVLPGKRKVKKQESEGLARDSRSTNTSQGGARSRKGDEIRVRDGGGH